MQNANQGIVFENAELNTAVHQFFVKCKNKNLQDFL